MTEQAPGKHWRLDWSPPGWRRPSYRSRAGAAETGRHGGQTRPSPGLPAHRGVQGRQADGHRQTSSGGLPTSPQQQRPVPGRTDRGDRERPDPLSETNGMCAARGYRVRMDAEYAISLAGSTSCARTRYRLAGPRSAGRTLPAGTRDRPAVPRWNSRRSGRGGCQRDGFFVSNPTRTRR